jgi:hypothetical protein
MSTQQQSTATAKTIACLGSPGLTALDLVEPLEVLNCLTPDYQAITVGERIDACLVKVNSDSLQSKPSTRYPILTFF